MRPLPAPPAPSLSQDLAFLDRWSALADLNTPTPDSSDPNPCSTLPLPALVGLRWSAWIEGAGGAVDRHQQQRLQEAFWPELAWPDRPRSATQRKTERKALKDLVRKGPLAPPPFHGTYLRPRDWKTPLERPSEFTLNLESVVGIGMAALLLRLTVGTPWTAWLGALVALGYVWSLGSLIRWKRAQGAVRRHNARLLPGACQDAAHRASIAPRRQEQARWAQHPALAAYAQACAESPAGWMEGDRVRLNAAWDRLRYGMVPKPAVPVRSYDHITRLVCTTASTPG